MHATAASEHVCELHDVPRRGPQQGREAKAHRQDDVHAVSDH